MVQGLHPRPLQLEWDVSVMCGPRLLGSGVGRLLQSFLSLHFRWLPADGQGTPEDGEAIPRKGLGSLNQYEEIRPQNRDILLDWYNE